MAVRRPVGGVTRRKPRRVKFRARRGVKSHGGSVFRSHSGHRKGGAVFRAHAAKAMSAHRGKAVRLAVAKLAAYRAVGAVRNPYRAKPKATAYKAVGRKMPASWGKPHKRPARFRAAVRR